MPSIRRPQEKLPCRPCRVTYGGPVLMTTKHLLEEAVRAVGGALATHAEAVDPPCPEKCVPCCSAHTDQEKHAAEVEARCLPPAAVVSSCSVLRGGGFVGIFRCTSFSVFLLLTRPRRTFGSWAMLWRDMQRRRLLDSELCSGSPIESTRSLGRGGWHLRGQQGRRGHEGAELDFFVILSPKERTCLVLGSTCRAGTTC